MEIAPGAHHYRASSSHRTAAHARASLCRTLVDGAVPAYVPIVRGGGAMHVRMLCLGRHWNARTYQYESTRGPTLMVCRLRRFLLSFERSLERLPAKAGMTHRAGSLHPQLLRRRRQDGIAPGQGRRSRIDCRGHSRRIGLDRRHRALSVRRAEAARSGRRRLRSNRATRSCSAGPRGCAITACRASLRARLRRSSDCRAAST